MVFVGGRHSVSVRLQTLASFPPGCFENPGDGGCQLWGGWGCASFTLAFLPSKPVEVPVLANNVALQGR